MIPVVVGEMTNLGGITVQVDENGYFRIHQMMRFWMLVNQIYFLILRVVVVVILRGILKENGNAGNRWHKLREIKGKERVVIGQIRILLSKRREI